LNSIVKSKNSTIVDFNKSVLAETYAARLAGQKAYDVARGRGLNHQAAKNTAKASAEVKDAVVKTRRLINDRAKRLIGKICRFLPFVGAGMVLFQTGDVRAASREAFTDLTGLDGAVVVGEFLGVGYELIQSGLESTSQQVHDVLGFP
jgi:hypothetical protein